MKQFYFQVGRHKSEDVKKGTLNAILRDAGLK
jgi:predicted RNA binding protein YcfA (HicA-like mRNA interferase family)